MPRPATALAETMFGVSRRGGHRIAFWQCSCVLVSTMILTTPASGLLSLSLHRWGFVTNSKHYSISNIRPLEGYYSRDKIERQCGIPESSIPARQYRQSRPCIVPVLQSHTQLHMSTSAPSGEWDVSDSSVFDSEEGDDYGEEVEEENEDDNESSSASAALLEDHERWTKAVDKAVTALGKKRKSLQSELSKAEGAEATAARAQLLVSNLYLFKDGTQTATVNDWENDGAEVELTLSGDYDSASAEADALFALVRKLKRGSKIVAELLEQTDASWEILEDAQADLASSRSVNGGGDDDVDEGRLALIKDKLIRTARATKFQPPTTGGDDAQGSRKGAKTRRDRKPELGSPASNVRKLLSPGGCVVLVGRNRRGNEYLSMTVARGDDVWMHSRGCPGAHVIVQNRRGSPTPTDDCLQFGADLAIFYSDLRNEQKAAVTAAQPRHIQKPRGAPLGAVKLREEWYTLTGFPDNVPDILKEARDQSGQTDEYHMLDKAKHRKRTKQVAAEDRAKRRQQQREKKNSK